MTGLGAAFKSSVNPPTIPSAERGNNIIGPATYTPTLQENTGTAAQWSKRSGSRKLEENPQFKRNSYTPGPQQYEIEPTRALLKNNRGKFLAEERFKGTR